MSKTSTALRRFGVGVLSAATMSTGLVAFAGSASAATADITGLTIAPTSSATSTGENTCQLYTVTATESGNATGGTATVQLQPTGGIDSIFCSGTPSTANSNATNGGMDQADFTIGGNNEFTFGVNENNGTPTQGQIAIKVYPQNTTTPSQPAAGAPVANATQNILTASAQNDVVTALSVDPTTGTGTEGNQVAFEVSAKNGSSSVVQDAKVYYTVKSSQGNSVGQDNVDCGGTTDQNGQIECDVTVPATTTVQSGPYTVTFKAPQNASGQSATPSSAIPATNAGPSTTATLNSTAPAPANSAVYLDCATLNYAPYWCEESGAQRSEHLTARVFKPASSSSTTATVPAPGVEVDFFLNSNGGNGSDGTFSPTSCITGADGTCTTTFTRAADDTGINNTYDEVYAQIVTTGGTFDSFNTGNDDWTYLSFGTDGPFESPATNIKGQTAQTGTTKTTKTVTFNLSNQYGDASNETCFTDNFDLSGSNGDACDSLSGVNGVMSTTVPVTLTITGAGTFSDGTTQKTVDASNGVVQVAVTSNANGTSTITGNLDPSSTDCGVAAPSTSNSFENDYFYTDKLAEATAGNCSASSTITWSGASVTPPPTTGRQGVSVKLACFSHRVHRVTCVAQLSKNIGGVTVVFWDNHGNKIGTDVTNRFGHARIHLHGLKSHVKHRYQAHAKKSSKTRSAWSRFATVFVK